MSVSHIKLNDGNQIPAVGYGLGTANYGKDSKDAVLLALKEGYYHIDTAEAYRNASSLGAALKETSVSKSDLWITAKCLTDPRKVLKQELESFGVDKVDLFLLHTPTTLKEGVQKAWAVCEELQAEGLTKSIGVSNFGIEDLEELLKNSKVVPAVNQIEFHPYLYAESKPLLDFCHQHGITIEVYGGLAPITNASGGEVDGVVEKIAQSTGYNAGQVLLKWASQVTKGVIVTTSSKSERLQEQRKVFTDMPDLSQADLDAIIKAGSSKNYRHFKTMLSKSKSAAQSPALVFMGNPLLDMQVTNGEALLEKYGLNANDAILAEEKHMPIYDEIVEKHDVVYVAGGAAQNAARAAAYILGEGHVAYIGCVGKDDLAKTLEDANNKEGVRSAYQTVEDKKTGSCAVVLTGHDRSLCTNLGAAESFSPDHLKTPEVKALIDNAKEFYIGGFFLTHGIESALEVAKQASGRGKVIAVNLSAPFIPQFFKVQLDQLLPYVDIVIGNEAEAAAWAGSQGMAAESEISQIATAIANLPKHNASRPRLVLITQGAESTIAASSSPSASPSNIHPGEDNPKTFAVEKLASDKIVDTNGAGDMFAGGFMAAHSLGKTLQECVDAGHVLGGLGVQQIGPTLPYPKHKVF